MADPVATAAGYELNLEEYWQIIRRRRWVILLCACSVGVFSGLFSWLKQPPPLYSSSASVKISHSTNVADMLLQSLSVGNVNDMRTKLSIITSYALMERVAKRLGMIPKDLPSAQVRANPEYMDVILDLKGDVKAEQESDSGIINIKVVSSDPEFARDLAQAVAEEFRAYNIEEKNRRVFEAKKFIQQQLTVVGQRLKAAEEAVRDFREKHNLSSAEEGTGVLSKVVADMEKEYRHQAEKLNDLRFALAQLRKRIQKGGWDYKAVTVSGKVSSYFDELNKRLVEMALKHTELSTIYTDDHPQMRELREQANDILVSMVDELDKQVAHTRQRMADLQRNIEETEKKYRGLPEQALELRRLERAVRTNEALYNLLEKKYQEVLIREAGKVEEVSIIRPAMVSHVRINPPTTKKTTISGFILGLVLGLVIAMVLEAMDTSVGTIEEVESFLELPVLGVVPHLSHDEAVELFSGIKGLAVSGPALERQLRLIAHFLPSSSLAEAYRSMRTSLLYSREGEFRVILVTSATVEEGKSMITSNLAAVVAQQGARVLLIDAAMRKPTQHGTFGLKREPGLSEYLLGQMPWRDAVRRISDILLGDFGVDQALMTPGLDQLDIMTSGHRSANPADLLAAPAMAQLLDEARQEYDMVIIDMPPLLHATDATVIAGKVDGVLLVYRIGAVVRGALRRARREIESVGGRMAGVVLNGVHSEMADDYGRFGSYDADRDDEAPVSRLDRVRAWLRRAWLEARSGRVLERIQQAMDEETVSGLMARIHPRNVPDALERLRRKLRERFRRE